MSENGVNAQIFNNLPDEMLVKIFGYFTSVADRFLLPLVARRFRDLVQVKIWRKKLVVKFSDLTGQYSNRLCTPVTNSKNLLVQEAMNSPTLECLEIHTGDSIFIGEEVQSEVLQFYENLRDFLTLFFNSCKKLKYVKCTITENRNNILAIIRPNELFLPSPSKCASVLSVCPLPFKIIEIPSSENCNELAHMLSVSKEIVERLSVIHLVLTNDLLSVVQQCEKLRIDLSYPHVSIVYEGFDIIGQISFLHLQNMEETFGRMILRNNSLLSIFFSLRVKQITIQFSDFYLIFNEILDHCTNLERLNVVNIYIHTGREYELAFQDLIDEILDGMSSHGNLAILSFQFNNSPIVLAERYIQERYTGSFSCQRDLSAIDTILIQKI